MKDKVQRFIKSLPNRGRQFAFLAVLAHILAFAYFFGPGHDWGGDFSLYIAQAEALIEGNTEELAAINRDCMLRSERRIGPDLYPIGLPLLLAPWMLIFGKSIAAFKVLNLLFFLASLALMPLILDYWGYRKQSYWLVGILAIHPFFIEFTHQIIAELPALFFALLGIYGFLRAGKKGQPVWLLVAGISLAFALLLKSLVITLIGALTIVLLLRWFQNRPKAFSDGSKFFLGLLVCYIPAKLFYPDSSGSYLEQLGTFSWDRIWNNFLYTIRLLKDLLIGRDILYYPVSALILLGILASKRRAGMLFPVLFLVFHVILLTLWPFHEGPRFMLILIPILFLFALLGLDFIRQHRVKVAQYASWLLIGILLPVLILEVQALSKAQQFPGKAACNNEHAEALWEFIRENTSQEDTFIFFKPRVLRLKTDRIGYFHDHLEGALSVHPDYYINVRSRGGFDDSTFTIAYQNPEFILFEFPPALR